MHIGVWVHDQNDWHHHRNIWSGIAAALFVFFFISFIPSVVTLISFLYTLKKFYKYIQRASFNSQWWCTSPQVCLEAQSSWASQEIVRTDYRKNSRALRMCAKAATRKCKENFTFPWTLRHSTGQHDISGKYIPFQGWPSQILICETSGNLTFFPVYNHCLEVSAYLGSEVLLYDIKQWSTQLVLYLCF